MAQLVARGRYSRDTRAVLERVQPDVAYETRFRRRSFATGRLIRRRAGGIAIYELLDVAGCGNGAVRQLHSLVATVALQHLDRPPWRARRRVGREPA
jgi:hypothetical protein